MKVRVSVLLFLTLTGVSFSVVACISPAVVDMGKLKNRDFAGQPVYSEKLYDSDGSLCGEVEVIKEHKRDKSLVKFAIVKYVDQNGQVILSENYTYTRNDGNEYININSRRKDGRISWILTFGTLVKLNEEETLLKKPKPILSYFRIFVSNIKFRSEEFRKLALKKCCQ